MQVLSASLNATKILDWIQINHIIWYIDWLCYFLQVLPHSITLHQKWFCCYNFIQILPKSETDCMQINHVW